MKRLIYLLAAVAFTACGSATSLSVMTFNMRYDNPEDGQNNWRFRRERVAGVIKAQEVDVLGTQELLSNQFNDLSGLLTGYQGVGVGRLDGVESGEYCAVFFRKDRFTLLDSGTFWLSETPEVVGSLGWDGACERIATWVVLRDRDGREFFFIDTHLDHVGQVARDEGVSLLMKRIETLSGGRPVILTGDFNSEPGSSVVAHVQKDGVLRLQGSEGKAFSVNFTCRVDRVDMLKDASTFERMRIIDYKTGSDEIHAPGIEAMLHDYKCKAFAQVMLYSQAYAQFLPYSGPIQPMVYSMRKLMVQPVSPLTTGQQPTSEQIEHEEYKSPDKSSKRWKILDYRDYLTEFNDALIPYLEELFNPDVPFVCADDDAACTYCEFKEICQRHLKK